MRSNYENNKNDTGLWELRHLRNYSHPPSKDSVIHSFMGYNNCHKDINLMDIMYWKWSIILSNFESSMYNINITLFHFSRLICYLEIPRSFILWYKEVRRKWNELKSFFIILFCRSFHSTSLFKFNAFLL